MYSGITGTDWLLKRSILPENAVLVQSLYSDSFVESLRAHVVRKTGSHVLRNGPMKRKSFVLFWFCAWLGWIGRVVWAELDDWKVPGSKLRRF